MHYSMGVCDSVCAHACVRACASMHMYVCVCLCVWYNSESFHINCTSYDIHNAIVKLTCGDLYTESTELDKDGW